jgi:hypothetical protein
MAWAYTYLLIGMLLGELAIWGCKKRGIRLRRINLAIIYFLWPIIIPWSIVIRLREDK